MGRTKDSQRPVVCPDTGEEFNNPADAAGVMRAVGHPLTTPRQIAAAIADGSELCRRLWDWKFPADWTPARRKAAECLK